MGGEEDRDGGEGREVKETEMRRNGYEKAKSKINTREKIILKDLNLIPRSWNILIGNTNTRKRKYIHIRTVYVVHMYI